MPVTARLSRGFYERFGDDLTNELVDWFNAVDATYRSDLRELNEINFARFDAKLEQRTAAIEARIDGLEARMDQRFEIFEAKFDAKLDQRFEGFEGKFDAKLDQRFEGFEGKFDPKLDMRFERFGEKFDASLERRDASLREGLAIQLAGIETRLMRWMFTLITGTMLGLAGLLFAVLRLN